MNNERISRRDMLRGGAAALALLAGLQLPAVGTANRSPNIILILADDQGSGDLGCVPHGSAIDTPHMDRLARDGVRFTQAYACASMCTPSRAGILSGIHPARLGIYDVSGDAVYSFPREVRLLPELLKASGYATGLIGKWHLGGEVEQFACNHPLARGFDRFWGFMGSTHDYWLADRGSGVNGSGYHDCGYQPIYDQREAVNEIGYLTDAISREAVRFIEAQRARPFFLQIAHHCPHVPLQVPRATYEKYAPLGYGRHTTLTRAMLAHLDAGVGEVLAAVERLGLADNTIVVYSSDNGGGEGSGQLNGWSRGGKFTLLEGGIRVPLLIRWPGKVTPGICDTPVTNLDLLPTLGTLAGLRVPDGGDGRDLASLLRGERTRIPEEPFYWKMPPREGEQDFAIREGRWKYVETAIGKGLYDLEADPSETCDLSAREPARVRELGERWRAWNARTIPSKFTSEMHARYMAPRASRLELENRSYTYSPWFGPGTEGAG